MRAVFVEGSPTPPDKSTASAIPLRGGSLRSPGNFIAPDPWRPSKFITDCEAPARAELARRARGRVGGPWEQAGDAALRAVRSAAVANEGAR
jgi:hypothetical protein